MAKTIRLDIVTPEKIVYSDDVNMLVARESNGYVIGILPNHAPLIAGLQIAPVRVKKDNGEYLISIGEGFIEVKANKVTILATCAELPEQIDVDRAVAAKERAELRLKERKQETDLTRAEAALKRAMVRLKVAEFNKRK